MNLSSGRREETRENAGQGAGEVYPTSFSRASDFEYSVADSQLVAGRLERISTGRASGWVCGARDGHLLSGLLIDVYIDDVRVLTAPVNEQRSDICQAIGVPPFLAGFSFSVEGPQFRNVMAEDFFRRVVLLVRELRWIVDTKHVEGLFFEFGSAPESPEIRSFARKMYDFYFDDKHYAAQVGSNAEDASYNSLFNQYMLQRADSKVSPNPLISPQYYLNQNHDVRDAGNDPLLHFVLHGDKEQRRPSPLFDSDFYKQRYKGSIKAEGPLADFMRTNQSDRYPNNWFEFCKAGSSQDDTRPFTAFKAFLSNKFETNPVTNSLFERFGSAAPLTGIDRAKGKGIDIIIPHYRNSEYALLCWNMLRWSATEINIHNGRVIIINDSPGDLKLTSILRKMRDSLKRVCDVVLIENTETVGFIVSSNAGLKQSVESGHDAVLLNSDAYLTPGCLSELAAVAYEDPMISVVSPRTNNATIATFPMLAGETTGWTLGEYHDEFVTLRHRLPRWHFVPVSVGFCLYIKNTIIDDFGLLDTVYGRGYFEENDLIMRANRAGYRAVLANHAYCFHIGSVSFAALETEQIRNEQVFLSRYPEFPYLLNHYEGRLVSKSEWLIAGLRRDKSSRILFDFSSLGTYFNGTFEAGLLLLRAMAGRVKQEKCLYVWCGSASARFHNLDDIPGITVLEPGALPADGVPFAVGLRFGQPFNITQVSKLAVSAAAVVFFMLDTIAQDCGNLFNIDVEYIWEWVAQQSDGIIFNSDFTLGQFTRRYPVGKNTKLKASLHSTLLSEYRMPDEPTGDPDVGIVIFGNKFEHKFVGPTLKRLSAAFPAIKITAVWDQDLDLGSRRILKAGSLTNELLSSLYQKAKIVVLPSHYEGFGMPVVRALAEGRVVFVRSGPLFDELHTALGAPDMLRDFTTLSHLIEKIVEELSNGTHENDGEHKGKGLAPQPETPKGARHAWADSADDVFTVLRSVVDDVSSGSIQLRLRSLSLLAQQLDDAGRPHTQVAAELRLQGSGNR